MDRLFAPQGLAAMRGLGAGLLAGSGYSPAPVSFGQALGGGLLGAEQAMQNQQRMALAQQAADQATAMQPLQMQLLRSQVSAAEREQQQQEALDAAIAGLPPDKQALARLDPSAYVKAQGQSGFYRGEGMPAQQQNVLIEGAETLAGGGELVGPQRRAYMAAWNQMAQPRVTIDPVTGAQTVIQPDMSAFPQLEPPSQPTRPQTVPAAAPAARPAGRMAPMTRTQQMPGATVTTTGPTEGTAVEQKEFRDAATQIYNLENAYTRYRDHLAKHGSILLPGPEKDIQQSLYTSLLLQMKEAANLGVLAGPDLDLMQAVVSQPGTMGREAMGWFMGPDAGLTNQLDQAVGGMLADKRSQAQQTYGRSVPRISQPGQGVQIDDRFYAEEDIQQTMREEGMTRQQVIDELRARGTMQR